MYSLHFTTGYEIMQDVHDLGEQFGITKEDFDSDASFHCLSAFEPLDRLAHLQHLFAKQPYFGRDLRYFNTAPWWYRLRFDVPADAPDGAVLRVGPVDYFAQVWLNGQKLGSHEGYFAPFGFEVGNALKRGECNTLLVKVSAPWDEQVMDGQTGTRFWDIVRHQIKGTYEHADTFVQRDVNPIGMLKPVQIDFYENAYIRALRVNAALDGAEGRVTVVPDMIGTLRDEVVRATLKDPEGRLVAAEMGTGALTLNVKDARLWNCVGHGAPDTYSLEVELLSGSKPVQSLSRTVGFRAVELRRTEEHTEYYLNGRRVFVRATTYFPDVYQSAMSLSRYRRDLTMAVRAGMNALRIHVHVEQPEFYELCDELGLMVIQDSDLNWVHPRDTAFGERACSLVREMLLEIGHHPCIVTWILYNEPDRSHDDYYMNVCPGPQLEKLARELTPEIPTIRGSYCDGDLHSGDSHNYLGSLNGHHTHYLDTLGRPEKFNTEFGIDAPPCPENLWIVPAIAKRLNLKDADIASIQHYQYRLIKFYIEHYRMQKYHNMGGYVQFMFIDFCPQSFYGVLDYWGMAKPGYEALIESNQPLLACLEHDTESRALWAINDSDEAIDAVLCFTVVDAEGKVIEEGDVKLHLPADGCVRACEYTKDLSGKTLTLELKDDAGRSLHKNRYVDPLKHPSHPEGHPHRLDAEIGMRLFHGGV